MKYKIAVTSRIVDTEDYDEIRDAVSHDLIDYLVSLNAKPLIIPNNEAIAEEYLNESKLLFLSGGNNVSDNLSLSDKDYSSSLIRDSVEKILVNYAIKESIPIIGICRGMQFLNCYFGGTLDKLTSPHIHNSGDHEVHFSGDSSSFTKFNSLTVNSYHNFVIKKLGKNLKSLAKSDDGYTEAFEHDIHPIFGLMWHPERKTSNLNIDVFNKNLIKKLLDL